MFRHDSGEHVDPRDALAQFAGAHRRDPGAGDDVLGIGEPDVARDRARGARVVAGDHHRADARAVALGDRRGHGRPYRIGKSDQPREAHVKPALRCRPSRIALAGRPLAPRDGEHAQAVPRHAFDRLMHDGTLRRRERAQVGDRLRRPLGRDDERLRIGAAPDARDGELRRRQRVAVDQLPLREARGDGGKALAREAPERLLHRIERLALAREDAALDQLPARPVVRPFGLEHPLTRPEATDLHPVLRERPGLVDAQHLRRAERLDRRRAARQHALARYPPCAKRQEDGEDDGKFLGQVRHRERDAGEQAVQPVRAHDPVEQRDEHAKRRADDREHDHRLPRFALQRARLGLDRRERLADSSHLGAASDRHDTREALPAREQRARVDVRKAVTAGARPLGAAVRRALVHRHRFAGEQRLVGHQIGRRLERGVRRHAVALLHAQQIPDDHFPSGDRSPFAVAQHLRARARELAQRVERTLGLALLVERDADHHEHRRGERQRLAQVAEREIDRRRPDQQQEHRLAHHLPRDRPRPARPGRRQLVVAVAREARGGLPGRQRARGRARGDLAGTVPRIGIRFARRARARFVCRIPPRSRLAPLRRLPGSGIRVSGRPFDAHRCRGASRA